MVLEARDTPDSPLPNTWFCRVAWPTHDWQEQRALATLWKIIGLEILGQSLAHTIHAEILGARDWFKHQLVSRRHPKLRAPFSLLKDQPKKESKKQLCHPCDGSRACWSHCEKHHIPKQLENKLGWEKRDKNSRDFQTNTNTPVSSLLPLSKYKNILACQSRIIHIANTNYYLFV